MEFDALFRGHDLDLVKDIRKHKNLHNILTIDPSSHNVGYCYVENLNIIDNGVIKLGKSEHVSHRLNELVGIISQRWPNLDALAIEKIRGSRAHIYLFWSVGVVVGAANTTHIFEIPVSAWNKMRDEKYTKTDKNDARMMARFVIGSLGGNWNV